jgi:hypothetical protein
MRNGDFFIHKSFVGRERNLRDLRSFRSVRRLRKRAM